MVHQNLAYVEWILSQPPRNILQVIFLCDLLLTEHQFDIVYVKIVYVSALTSILSLCYEQFISCRTFTPLLVSDATTSWQCCDVFHFSLYSDIHHHMLCWVDCQQNLALCLFCHGA
jgi:hypothetical protein